MINWSITFDAVVCVDYDNARRLSFDNKLEGPERRRYFIDVPCVLNHPNAVLATAMNLRSLADWLEREAHRVSTLPPT